MRDIAFFSKLLALKHPWRVEHVSLDTQQHHINVWLAHRRNASFMCPECGRPSPLYDHVPSRSWRHLDHGDCLTWLQTPLPRIACPVHGIRRVRVPWALPGSRFTLAFERYAIDVLLETDVLGGARLLHISWDETWNIMERAVARGLRAKKRRVIAHLGVDEKAVAKRHRYVTLVCDLDRSTVEYIGDDRKQTSLDAYYQSLSQKQLAGIEAVAMDMWDPFIASTVAHVPNGQSKIVFDRFHVMKHMTDAVDQVRKEEHRLLQAGGDETLKGTKYLWLFSEENLPERSRERFAALRARHLKTGRAWAIKESLRDLWDYRRKGWALRHWKHWYFWATHSRLKPVVKVARMIQGHLDNVLTYFDHRITNATSEGLNSKIQTIKKTPMGSAIGSI
ncbi:MAG: ISL3 family transposase [Planctomycetaceae bacterium]|nr:ISL3 family transposase [Planctomycetaceae bacterium]